MAGKKFRFSLQSVLTLRSHEAEQARQELGKAATVRQEHEEQVTAAREALEQLPGVRPADRPVRPTHLQRQEAHRHAALRRHDEARRRLATVQEREAEARAALRRQHQAEESLKTLRHKERDAHRYEQERADAAFLDELAGFRRAKPSSASRPYHQL